jgi:glycosyltransferase involved in cell wall biosynthesis
VSHDQRFSLLRGIRPWRVAGARVVRELGPDVVHGQGILVGGVVAAAVPGPPRIVTARGNARRDTLEAYRGVGARLRASLRDHYASRVVRSVDAIVGVHPDWRINLPVEPRRLVHIPNIVDEVFFSVQRAPVGETVLYCGGTRRIKGWDLLEAAWGDVRRAVPGAELRVVGWPDDTGPPELPGIDVEGPLDAERLAAAMAAARLVVIPSRYEVAPIVLAEAWASGTPVVATSAGGMASLAPGAAILVPPESPRALAQAIVGALDGTLETAQFVDSGRTRAQRHRAVAVAAAHVALYAEIPRT